jgi:hypothetical protein
VGLTSRYNFYLEVLVRFQINIRREMSGLLIPDQNVLSNACLCVAVKMAGVWLGTGTNKYNFEVLVRFQINLRVSVCSCEYG